MDAGKRNLSDIIKQTQILEVPFYQRSYVWGKEQWERLLEDAEMITLTEKEYFIGSLILKQQLTPPGEPYKRTIIDGQQRLTTLSVFFKALALKTDNQRKFDNRFKLEEEDTGRRMPAINHSMRDRKAFEKILNQDEPAEIKDSEGHNNKLIHCFNFFIKNIKPERVDFDIVYSRLMFVSIDLGREEDEQQIFDTINSLGVRLSTAELLKNYLFKEEDLSEYQELWLGIFEKDNSCIKYWEQEVTAGSYKRTLIDLFFYALLQIKIQDKSLMVDTKDKILFSKMDRLFESYKYFSAKYKVSRDDLLRDIKSYAQTFRQVIDPSIVEQPIEPNDYVNRVNNLIFGLKTTVLIPYILKVANRVELDRDKMNDVFSIIETYIVRRIIVKASNRGYNGLFSESLLLNDVYTRKDFLEFINEKSDRDLYLPQDEELKEAFNEAKLTNYNAKGVLYLLESKIRDANRNSNSLLSINSYSLEHLMPKKWENNWGKLDDQEQVDYRNSKLLTLGNLTIITQSLNATIRDASWRDKLQGDTKKHGGLIAYSSGIQLFSDLIQKEKWDESAIEERANYLYEKSIEVWKAK
ncbi:DUF262 domain-containing protein [Candidatus Saccharibacteria bacterium]|jgi:uncharacterized protein with ParB-like and HNH nuclease domain|nr:DUF262 domain-containing protein [Candidatus Saccharibacteria bacterium]